MKLEFKFNGISIVSFLILCGLFYWLCPLPAAALWRGIVCVAVSLFLFFICFVVVTHKNIVRKK